MTYPSPLEARSNTQVWVRNPNQPFRKNALQCTGISLVERRKNKQQMLVTLLSTLLEGIQIYCD